MTAERPWDIRRPCVGSSLIVSFILLSFCCQIYKPKSDPVLTLSGKWLTSIHCTREMARPASAYHRPAYSHSYAIFIFPEALKRRLGGFLEEIRARCLGSGYRVGRRQSMEGDATVSLHYAFISKLVDLTRTCNRMVGSLLVNWTKRDASGRLQCAGGTLWRTRPVLHCTMSF